KPTVIEEKDGMIRVFDENMSDTYNPLNKRTKGVWLQEVLELPPATEKLNEIVRSVEQALPGITNQLAQVLTQSAHATSNLNALALSARPTATNLAEITAQLREFNGSLGRWL